MAGNLSHGQTLKRPLNRTPGAHFVQREAVEWDCRLRGSFEVMNEHGGVAEALNVSGTGVLE